MDDELKIELQLILEPSYGSGNRCGSVTIEVAATHEAIKAAIDRSALACQALGFVGWVDAVIGNDTLTLAELWADDRYHELVTIEPSRSEPPLRDRLEDAIAALKAHA